MPDADPYAHITAASSTLTFAEAFADPEFIKLAMPEVVEGGQCFDFDLPVYDFSTGTGIATGDHFHLATASANQPVALIFGSYT